MKLVIKKQVDKKTIMIKILKGYSSNLSDEFFVISKTKYA